MSSNFFLRIKDQVKSFAKANKVAPNDVHIHVTLADGSSFIVHSLKTSPPDEAPGWGALDGFSDVGSPRAIVIREEHIFRAELRLAAEQGRPIGFAGEAGK